MIYIKSLIPFSEFSQSFLFIKTNAEFFKDEGNLILESNQIISSGNQYYQICERLSINNWKRKERDNCPPGTLMAVEKIWKQQGQINVTKRLRKYNYFGKQNENTPSNAGNAETKLLHCEVYHPDSELLNIYTQIVRSKKLDIFYTGILCNTEKDSSDTLSSLDESQKHNI